MNLADRASSYWEDARVLEGMVEFEADGLSGPMWATVYRAVAVELRTLAAGTCDPRCAIKGQDHAGYLSYRCQTADGEPIPFPGEADA